MKKLLLATAFLALALAGCLGPGQATQPPLNVTSEALYEPVSFHTPDGWTLPGIYYRPLGPTNHSVLMLHDLAKSSAAWADTIQTMQYSGFAVLVVDQRGHGDSSVNGSVVSYGQFQPEEYQRMVDDVGAFVNLLRQRRPNDKISIVGASIGANVALNYAARDKNVSSVILLSPGIDYRGVTTINTIVQYGARPLFLVASREDEYGAYSAKRLAELASPGASVTLTLLDGAGHGTEMLARQPDLVRQMRDWLAKN